MSDVPEGAIEAAAEVVHREVTWATGDDAQRIARTAIEAAMPAIREAIAQEIADVVRDELATQSEFMHETHDPQFRQGILWASLHARLFLTEIWKPNVRGTP